MFPYRTAEMIYTRAKPITVHSCGGPILSPTSLLNSFVTTVARASYVVHALRF